MNARESEPVLWVCEGATPLNDAGTARALSPASEKGLRAARVPIAQRFTAVLAHTEQRLVEIVIAREVNRGMQDLLWEGAQTLEDRLVAGFEFAGRYVRGHPLFDRLLRSEPEVLLPPLTLDGGPVLEPYRSLIAQRLQAEINAGRAATSDIDGVAEVIARLAISLLLTRDGTITLEDPQSVRRLVNLTLLPMLQPHSD